MGNRLTSLFNLSFEDSKKIMFKRWGIQDHTFYSNKLKYRDSNYNFPNRLFATIGIIGFLIIELASGKGFSQLGENTKFINPYTRQLIHIAFQKLEGIIWLCALVLGISLITYLFLPPRNFAYARIEGFNLLFLLIITGFFAYLPTLIGLVLGTCGTILGWITLGIMGAFLPFSLVKYIKDLQSKVYGRNDMSIIYKSFLYFLVGIIGIDIVIGLVRTNFGNTLIMLLFIIVYLAVVFGFKYFINCFFNYYYMLKYSTEYRKYYKIPDAAWYLSNRRAKKHPHVYTIGDELKEKE